MRLKCTDIFPKRPTRGALSLLDPTRGSAQNPFQFQRYSSTKHSFFVRTVPAWNALVHVSFYADSVAVFRSSISNNFMC